MSARARFARFPYTAARSELLDEYARDAVLLGVHHCGRCSFRSDASNRPLRYAAGCFAVLALRFLGDSTGASTRLRGRAEESFYKLRGSGRGAASIRLRGRGRGELLLDSFVVGQRRASTRLRMVGQSRASTRLLGRAGAKFHNEELFYEASTGQEGREQRAVRPAASAGESKSRGELSAQCRAVECPAVFHPAVRVAWSPPPPAVPQPQ